MKESVPQNFTDQTVLYGVRGQRFIREFVTHSGIFWMFNFVTNIGSKGLITHLGYLPQWVMFGAALVQSWVISRDEQEFRWWYVFIAPALYTLVDVAIEGWQAYTSEIYHPFYWIWAACMGVAYWLGQYYASLAAFLRAVFLVILLPALYFFAEIESGLIINSVQELFDYWLNDSAHFFILFGAIVLGVALGTINIMRERFEKLLYGLATHFEEIASWSFDKDLMEQSYADDTALHLQRVQRTVLFMDIRSFTPWSEAHLPDEVVQMVNRFYGTAEPIIKQHNGFKIQMTGDEIMTRFSSPQDALNAAVNIQPQISAALAPYGLSAGIGIHTGDVVEGLVGGQQTRQYGIFGDTVNTAARLQGQSQANEIIVSESTWQQVKQLKSFAKLTTTTRQLTLKGKAEPMNVIVILPA